MSACALAVCRTKHIYGVVRFITSSDEPTILKPCIKEYNTMKTIGSRLYPTISDSPRSTATSLQCYSTIVCPYTFNLLRSLLLKKTLSCSSSHFKSALLSPGPPAQWPQILGNTSNCPTPGFMCATSYSESSGLQFLFDVDQPQSIGLAV